MTKTLQFEHQKIGTAALVKNPAFALFDEPGAGKSKQVIDSACQLAEQGKIDTVIIVAPASVRCVWLDAEIGEIFKHASVDSCVMEYHSKLKIVWAHKGHAGLRWIVTNYEFLRSEKNLNGLIERIDSPALLVCDESSYIKNRTSQQTKAVLKLRKHCARCVILNGTPISQSPLDLWAQMQVLSPDILEKRFKNWYAFRAQFCEMKTLYLGARRIPQVAGYKNLDKLAKIVALYVLRRLKSDCLDLPEKLYTEREVALTPESWKRYCELKKDALISLGSGEIRLEPNAAVRLLRLSQLTSGIYGHGGKELNEETGEIGEYTCVESGDLSDEKLRWCVQYLTEECTAKAVIVWTRWRRERERLVKELENNRIYAFQLYGGQSQAERQEAVYNFSKTDHSDNEAKLLVLIAQQHAGSHGLNLIAATEHIFLSNDFSLGIRLQAEDRSHRPGQKNAVTYLDCLAVGPKGQKTIDHTIFRALRDKKNVADLTTAEWRRELEAE